MNKKSRPYHVVDLTPGRRVWLNTLDLSWTPHAIYGLLEVDVTVARQFIAEHKAHTGESLSFTGYPTFCLARAVDEDKAVQAYLKSRKQIVIFDDVDVALMIEGQIGEKRALLGMVVRRDPTILVSMAGTVAITSVGMFGGGHSGWGLTPTGKLTRPGGGGYGLEASRRRRAHRAA